MPEFAGVLAAPRILHAVDATIGPWALGWLRGPTGAFLELL